MRQKSGEVDSLRWMFVQEGPAHAGRSFIDTVSEVEFWFHRECFESVAGKEYLSTKII